VEVTLKRIGERKRQKLTAHNTSWIVLQGWNEAVEVAVEVAEALEEIVAEVHRGKS
jgi:hypothetical protein